MRNLFGNTKWGKYHDVSRTMTPVSIAGYHASEELYNGSKTLVYRGYREIDQKPVIIKTAEKSPSQFPRTGAISQSVHYYQKS